MGAMRRRGQHEGGRKSPIDSSSRPQWAARRMAACVGAMRAAKRDACKTAAMNAGEMAGGACGKQARPAPQGAKPVRPCRVPHAAVAWRKARSVGPQAAAGERPGGAGNIFAPCILNRPIAPGNGCMGRGCCHLDLEEHAFRADVARKGAFFAHSAKKDAYGAVLASQGPGADATREGDADVGAR